MKLINKFREDKDFKRKFIGMFLILLGFLCLGYLIKILFFETAKKENLNDYPVKNLEENIYPQSKEHPNIKNIDNSLEYDIPQEILDKIDFNKLDKTIKNFLSENNLYTENTKVVSDYILTENFKDNSLEFRLTINNFNKSIILVKVKGDSIELTYY